MKILDEFKAFALKGNMIDMAVGIIHWSCIWQNCSINS